jgi:large conductance mechanosensitive channel
LIRRMGDSLHGLEVRSDAIAIAVGFAVALSTVYLVEAVVTSMVAPLISIFIGSFEGKTFTFHGSEFRYGMLVLALISFALVLVAAWLLLRSMSRGSREPGGAEAARPCPECVTPISFAAKRCPHCTAVIS